MLAWFMIAFYKTAKLRVACYFKLAKILMLSESIWRHRLHVLSDLLY